jgi:hypothetical protein
MLVSVLLCGRGSLLLTILFIIYHKILYERLTNRGHPTLTRNSNLNMEHENHVKLCIYYTALKMYMEINRIYAYRQLYALTSVSCRIKNNKFVTALQLS